MSCRQNVFRAMLLGLFFSICGAAGAHTVSWKPERTLGSAQLSLEEVCYLYLPSEPSARLRAAAEDLVKLWPATLEIFQAPDRRSKNVLTLERDHPIEGFFIRRDRTKVDLSASSDEALAEGLYAICRELLGARWYWEGDLGFERVGEITHKFPDGLWREQPAFVQRTLYPMGSDYGRRNGLNWKYSFNHNLARIFTKEVFKESPEAFAEINGKRRRPKGNAGTDPQPDFTESKTVELAVEATRAHFEKNPHSKSFSLSINDNSLFDEGLATAEAVVRGFASGWEGEKVGRLEGGQEAEGREQGAGSGEKGGGMGEERVSQTPDPGSQISHPTTDDGGIEYFRSRPNYTDLVFGFMNEVAEQVYEGEKVASGKVKGEKARDACFFPTFLPLNLPTFKPSHPPGPYLTALAYYWTEQSPSFELHPRIMPVLTSDRAQWHDPEYRAQDKALIQRWADSGAERIATWDYYFGAPYPYPRQFTQWIGESIKYLHDSGVDVFFSQLPSVWGLDGPKAWLTAELLRDPKQEVEVLLNEYYGNFFGPAAEPIREFYEIAEQTRNERAGTANWIKFYKDEAGIELFDQATLKRMRECIDLAMQGVEIQSPASAVASDGKLDPDRYLKRVQIVSEAFSYTESYATYHRKRVELVELAMASLKGAAVSGGTASLINALQEYQSARSAHKELAQRLAKKPMHRGFSTFNRQKQSNPTPLVLAALARSELDLERVLPEKSALLSSSRAWHEGGADLVLAGENSGLEHSGMELRNFLGPEVPVIDSWNIQYRASDGLSLKAARGQEGSGLRIENADIVSLAQTYPVLAEKHYLLQIDARWQVSPDNRSWVQLNWESFTGDKLQTDILLRLPNGVSPDKQTMQFIFTSPVNAYDLKVGIVTNRQYEGDYLEIQSVDLGRLMLKQ